MIFGLALGVAAILFGLLAWLVAGLGPLGLGASVWFAWCAFDAAWVACGYATLNPGVFGKSPEGERAWWARLLLVPYFVSVEIARWVQRAATGEAPYHLVAPGLYVGRLVATKHLPEDVALVVDLTAELTEPSATRERYSYRCLPTLDGTAPEVERLRAVADVIDEHPGPTYVHCAAGHGRAAMLTSVLLVRRGLAEDVFSAQRLMRRHRPRVRMTRHQRESAAAAV